MTPLQQQLKRTFDVCVSVAGIALLWPVILVSVALARWETGLSGIFRQERIGKDGRPFFVMKIRTMRVLPNYITTVTTDHDPRITRLGRIFRKLKIDELPQLFNVLWGEMSLVGPRPDVADLMLGLVGDDRVILSIRPGVTGPATLKYRNEEAILAKQENPEEYNRTVIFPDKVRLNRKYIENYRFIDDLNCLFQTAFRCGPTADTTPLTGDSEASSHSDQSGPSRKAA